MNTAGPLPRATTQLRRRFKIARSACDVAVNTAMRGMEVAFFDDRIDIVSPGLLLSGMTVQDMQSGVSRIRNPVIARMFRELHLVEQWGSGVKRIFAEAAVQGLPEPQVTEIATGVRLSLFLHALHHPGTGIAPESHTTPADEQVSEQVSEQGMALLRHCSAQPRSKQDLLGVLGLSNAYLNYRRHVLALVEHGLIAMTLPGKPNSPLQRYRLTARGQALLGATAEPGTTKP